MIQTRFVLEAYLDANILLACAWLIWLLARLTLAGAGLGRAWGFRLNLLQGTILAVIASPFLALGLGWVLSVALPGTAFRLADMAVSQYLDGNLRMDAAEFEGLLGLRTRFVHDLVQLRTPVSIAVAAALAVGVAWYLGRGVRRALRLAAVVRGSFLLRRGAGVEVRLSDRVRVPFSTRFVHRRIVLIPAQMLSRPQHLRIALAHEFQHMRRGDVEWEMVLELIRPLFFWNPAFLFWKREIENLRELSCDQSLLQRRCVSARDYLDCLLQVCEDGLDHSRRTFVVVPQVPLVLPGRAAFGRRSGVLLRRRVAAALDGPCRFAARRWAVPAGLLALTVTITLAALAIQRPGDWSQDRLMLSTIVNLERLEARNAILARLANY